MSPRNPEARRPTHDGYIWPTLRHAMTDGTQILDRMAGEARALLDARGADADINESDFYLAGWERQQIEAYGPRAVAIALQPPPNARPARAQHALA